MLSFLERGAVLRILEQYMLVKWSCSCLHVLSPPSIAKPASACSPLKHVRYVHLRIPEAHVLHNKTLRRWNNLVCIELAGNMSR